jgi:hypothetical protein
MTNQHPITPPPELVQEWIHEPQYMTEDQLGKRMNLISMNEVRFREIIDKISQYSADQELEACCEYMQHVGFPGIATILRVARRPKLPSLKERIAAAITDGDERTALSLLNEAMPNV